MDKMSGIIIKQNGRKFPKKFFKKKKNKENLFSIDLMYEELDSFNTEFKSFVEVQQNELMAGLYNEWYNKVSTLNCLDISPFLNSVDEVLKSSPLSSDDLSGFQKFNAVSGVIIESLFTFVSDSIPGLRQLIDTLREFKDISIILNE